MLSGEALDIAFALRSCVGALAQGDGPTMDVLRDAARLTQSEFATGLDELESIGFIVVHREAAPETRVIVLPPLQVYLEDLENQGSEDF
jgi:DNA-binding MarR family transcriptional regulator